MNWDPCTIFQFLSQQCGLICSNKSLNTINEPFTSVVSKAQTMMWLHFSFTEQRRKLLLSYNPYNTFSHTKCFEKSHQIVRKSDILMRISHDNMMKWPNYLLFLKKVVLGWSQILGNCIVLNYDFPCWFDIIDRNSNDEANRAFCSLMRFKCSDIVWFPAYSQYISIR